MIDSNWETGLLTLIDNLSECMTTELAVIFTASGTVKQVGYALCQTSGMSPTWQLCINVCKNNFIAFAVLLHIDSYQRLASIRLLQGSYSYYIKWVQIMGVVCVPRAN